MNTRRIVMALVGLMAVCQMAKAQANIDRIAEELEQKGVECNKVVTRNPNTKKVLSVVKSYEFRSKDGKYAEKLKKAFAKEAENSSKEISEKGGREQTLIFDTDDSHMVYALEIGRETPDPKVELSIIITYGKQKPINVFSPNFSDFNIKDFNESMKKFGIEIDSVGMMKYDSGTKNFNFDINVVP